MEEKPKKCPLMMLSARSFGGGIFCIREECQWYIGYPYFDFDCAFNQIAYALMVLASFGPKGAREVS